MLNTRFFPGWSPPVGQSTTNFEEAPSMGETGATLVEGTFAFTFMLIFFALTCEMALLCFTQLSMQYVLTRVARDVAVASEPSANNVIDGLRNRFNAFGMDFRPNRDLQGNQLEGAYEITVCPLEDLDTALCPAGSVKVGSAESSLIYRLRRTVTGISPGKSFELLTSRDFTLESVLVSKNEPR